MPESIIDRPCVKCGAVKRNIRTGKCTECVRRIGAEYRAANPDKEKKRSAAYRAANFEAIKIKSLAWVTANPERNKATQAAWYKANPERHRASVSARYEANKEKVAAMTKAWALANPESRKIHKHTRRAKEKTINGVLSKGLSAKLLQLQNGLCFCCKQPLLDKIHLDHWVPLALGGSNTDDNIRLLHPRCNQAKGAMMPETYMERINGKPSF